MITSKLSLGIDTSNYKTSVAVVDSEGTVLFNSQEFLHVKEGERGLRQSDALFQHIQRLPDTIEKVLLNESIRKNIGCVSVSTRPRPVEGSYMPVFTAGTGAAKMLGASLNVPVYEFSHQEGHIEAVKFYSSLKDTYNPFVCFHFSGGTTEAIYVDKNIQRFDIVGGSKDLAYGQVLDRIGVSLGFDFPCGEEMDRVALLYKENYKIFTKIKVKDCYTNLSGIETQGQRAVSLHTKEEVIKDLFNKLAQSIVEMTIQISEKYNVKDFIFAGGVSSSQYIRQYLYSNLADSINIVFGESKMSQDNAIGTALLGGHNIWL